MPSERRQFIRHDTSGANAFTGLEGEITIDTSKDTIRVHDGTTAGGVETAKADLSNATQATNSVDGKISAAQVTVLESALQSASNLSDVGNAATSRSNLGLGAIALKETLVVADVSGALAAASNLSDVANKDTSRANIKAVGTETTSNLLTGVTVSSVAKSDSGTTTLTLDNTERSFISQRVTGSYTINADNTKEGISHVLLTIDATGGYTITLGNLTAGIEGIIDVTANAKNHIMIHSQKDYAGTMQVWATVRNLT